MGVRDRVLAQVKAGVFRIKEKVYVLRKVYLNVMVDGNGMVKNRNQ